MDDSLRPVLDTIPMWLPVLTPHTQEPTRMGPILQTPHTRHRPFP